MSFFSWIHRIKASLLASSGEIVFGMSDGTVSILGLVLGIVAGGYSTEAVVLAGATGAIAASVSMMAGCFMEIQSERDEAEQEKKERIKEINQDPTKSVHGFVDLLQKSGMSAESIRAVASEIQENPLLIPEIEAAFSSDQETTSQKTSPVIHSVWMFFSDLIAGLTPVIPFIFFPLDTAWIVCIVVTAVLLILLGLGRARISNRSPLRTIMETMGITIAAAVAGVLVGRLLS